MIEKLKDGRFRACVEVGDKHKRKRKYKTFTFKKDARAWEIETLEKARKGEFVGNGDKILLKDFILDWFENHNRRSIKETSAYQKRLKIENCIIPRLGNYKLSEIKISVLQDFYNELSKTRSSSYSKGIVKIVIQCLQYAKKIELLQNINVDVEFNKKEVKHKIKYLTKDQVKILLDNIQNKKLYLPAKISLMTGMRLGEVLGLRWENVDFENKLIHVKEQIIEANNKTYHVDSLKTKTSHADIFISDKLVDELKTIYEKRKKAGILDRCDFVVMSNRFTYYNPGTIKRMTTYTIKSIQKKYPDFPSITFHCFRHTHATLLLEQGVSMKAIQERLRHANISMSMDVYSHVTREMSESTRSKLDDLI